MFNWIKGPIVKRLLTSGIRAGLVAASSWLVAKGYATEQEGANLVVDLLPIAVALAWSAWEAAQVDKKIETALKMPAGKTKADLEKVMQAQS